MSNSKVDNFYQQRYPLLYHLMKTMVPIRIAKIIKLGGPDVEDINQALNLDDFLSIHWNTILNSLDSNYRDDETAMLVNQLAESIAVLAFLEGGVTVLGMQFVEEIPSNIDDTETPEGMTEEEYQTLRYYTPTQSEWQMQENNDFLEEMRELVEAYFEEEVGLLEERVTPLPLPANSPDALPLPLPQGADATTENFLPLPATSGELPLPAPATSFFLEKDSTSPIPLPLPMTDTPLPLPASEESQGSNNKLLPPG